MFPTIKLSSADGMRDDPEAILATVKKEGGVVLRGLTPTGSTFEAFTDRFPLGYIPHQGPAAGFRFLVEGVDPTIATVTRGLGPINWHNERGYVPVRPDFMFFFCVKPPKLAGETMIVDGRDLYQSLDEKFREQVDRVALTYAASLENTHPTYERTIRFLGAETAEQAGQIVDAMNKSMLRPGETWESDFTSARIVYRFSYPLARAAKWTDDRVVCGFFTEPLPKIESTGEVSPTFIGQLSSAAYRAAYFHHWEAGDVIVIDNHRVMHARNATNDPERSILVRMAIASS